MTITFHSFIVMHVDLLICNLNVLFVPLIYSFMKCYILFCSRDCPIFYRRKKAQKDMAEARRHLERWNF